MQFVNLIISLKNFYICFIFFVKTFKFMTITYFVVIFFKWNSTWTLSKFNNFLNRFVINFRFLIFLSVIRVDKSFVKSTSTKFAKSTIVKNIFNMILFWSFIFSFWSFIFSFEFSSFRLSKFSTISMTHRINFWYDARSFIIVVCNWLCKTHYWFSIKKLNKVISSKIFIMTRIAISFFSKTLNILSIVCKKKTISFYDDMWTKNEKH